MKKTILAFIIGGIVFSFITATAAYVYTARDINYQSSDENWSVDNVQEALTELKSDVNNINNKVEGIERIYKAGEVELVALVSDDSFYTDSNGKYVLSNSDTGRALLADTSTYKSISSTDDCVGIFGGDTVSVLGGSIKLLKTSGSGQHWATATQSATISDDTNIFVVSVARGGAAGTENANISITTGGDLCELISSKRSSYNYNGSGSVNLLTNVYKRTKPGTIVVEGSCGTAYYGGNAFTFQEFK